jgi:acetylornithine aminotransferase
MTMALRISAKRAAAVLKSQNAFPARTASLVVKRNASQATAAASNLDDGAKNEIYVCHLYPIESMASDSII